VGLRVWATVSSRSRTSDDRNGSTPASVNSCDRLRVGGRVTTRAEDAQGTPTQSRISPSILGYEDNPCVPFQFTVSGVLGARSRVSGSGFGGAGLGLGDEGAGFASLAHERGQGREHPRVRQRVRLFY